MTTSAKTFELSKPKDGQRIPLGVLGYARGKFQNDLHAMILRALENSGISQAELARRLGKRPEIVSRNIGGSGNWTLSTVSDLLFAINGTFVSVAPEDLIEAPRRNHVGPDWLFEIHRISKNGDDVGSTDNSVVVFPDRSEKRLPSGSSSTEATYAFVDEGQP